MGGYLYGRLCLSEEWLFLPYSNFVCLRWKLIWLLRRAVHQVATGRQLQTGYLLLSRHFPYFPSAHKSPCSLNPIAWFFGLSCLQLV